MQGFQPGLNLNIDSFSIQNNSQNQNFFSSQEKSSTVSFFDLVQNEISKNDDLNFKTENNFENVQSNRTDANTVENHSELSKSENSVTDEKNDLDKNDKIASTNSDEKNLESQNQNQKTAASFAESVKNQQIVSKTENDFENSQFSKIENSKNQKNLKSSDKKNLEHSSNILKSLMKNPENQNVANLENQQNILVEVENANFSDSKNISLKNEKSTFTDLELNKDFAIVKNGDEEYFEFDKNLLTQILNSKNQNLENKNKISLEKNLAENKKVENLKSKKSKTLSDVISVTDLRTDKKIADVKNFKKGDFVTSIKQTSSDSVQMTVDLSSAAEKNILSLNSQNASSVGSNFQAMLENQIAENSSDFVKAGNIVLKDNNVGKINLVLHPESLGNVKISLELSDKIITGKIIVSSQEAFRAFDSTQENLKNAFIESGFENASFDISFANQNQNYQGNQQETPQHNFAQLEKAYNNFSEENSLVEENNSDIKTELQKYSIDFVA